MLHIHIWAPHLHVCMPSLCTPADEYGEMVNNFVELHHCNECVVDDQMSHPYMGTTPTKVLPLSSILYLISAATYLPCAFYGPPQIGQGYMLGKDVSHHTITKNHQRQKSKGELGKM